MRSTSCWSANYCSISRLPTPSCPSPLTSSHAFHPSGAPRLRHNNHEAKVAVLIIGLSYPLETALSNKITRNTIVLSFKDSPRKPLRRRLQVSQKWGWSSGLEKGKMRSIPLNNPLDIFTWYDVNVWMGSVACLNLALKMNKIMFDEQRIRKAKDGSVKLPSKISIDGSMNCVLDSVIQTYASNFDYHETYRNLPTTPQSCYSRWCRRQSGFPPLGNCSHEQGPRKAESRPRWGTSLLTREGQEYDCTILWSGHLLIYDVKQQIMAAQ